MIGRTNGQMGGGGGSGSIFSFDNYIYYIIDVANTPVNSSLDINKTLNLKNPNKRIGILTFRNENSNVNLDASITFNSEEVDTLVPYDRVPDTTSSWFGIIKPKEGITSITGHIVINNQRYAVYTRFFEIPDNFVGGIMHNIITGGTGPFNKTYDLESVGLKPPFNFICAGNMPTTVSGIDTKCYMMPRYEVPLRENSLVYIGISNTNPTITYSYDSVINQRDVVLIY